MPHVIKYLLVLAILMSGFYMAHKFRAPDDAEMGAVTPTEIPTPEPERAETPSARTQLPVAALVDVDKTPAFGGFESETFDAERRSVKKQPTVKEAPKANREDRSSDQSTPDKTNKKQVAANGGKTRAKPNERANSERANSDRESANSEPDSEPSYNDPLPDFAEKYQPWLNPLEEAKRQSSSDGNAIDEEDPWSQTALGSGIENEVSGPRRHEIAVGDTLELLALQYLGDPDRRLEIYEANLDVLFHPRLLPIGVEICIPSSSDTTVAANLTPLQDESHPADPSTDAGDVEDDEAASDAAAEHAATDGGETDESAASNPARDKGTDDSSWRSTN